MKAETQKTRKKRFPQINISVAVGVLLLVVVAGLIILKVTHKHKGFPITIGSTRITVQDVNNYAAELKAYSKLNPNSNFGGSPTQVAVNDLVLNAAFKQEAQKLNKPLTDSDIAQANSYGGTMTTAQQQQYLAVLHSENKALQIRAQNIAYEQKFDSTFIARKNLMIAGIDFDTPYFANAPQSQVQSLYDQAKARVQNTIMPLLQQKASDTEIGNHVDLSFKNGLLTKGNDNYQQYFQKAVLDMDVKTGYTDGESLFNDIDSTGYLRGNVGKLYSTNAKIDSLKNVGDNTGVFASKAGIFMVIRLDSKTGGSYNSWSDFLAHYKQMYGLTSTSLTKQLGTKVASSINNVVESLASIGEGQADATTVPGGCGQHNVQFTARSWDTVANTPIGGTGTTFQEYRPPAGYDCPGTVSGTATATTGGPNNTIDDNCFAPAPSWAVNALASGYTPVSGGPYTPQPQPYTPGATWDNSAGGKSVAIRSGPDPTIGNGDDYNGWPIWTPGTINDTGHIYIVFLYKGNPPTCTDCTCTGTCPVGRTVTCTNVSLDGPSGSNQEYYAWVSDSSGNTELGSTVVHHGSTWNASFQPEGQQITLYAYTSTHNSDGTWTNGATHAIATSSGNCFGAVCSMYVDGNLPDGGVLAGTNYTVTVTFSNTSQPGVTLPSSVPGHGLDLTTGPGGGPGVGTSIPPGGSATFSFTQTAGGPGTGSVSGYPDYHGAFALGSSCGTSFNIETRSASCTINSIVGTLPGGYVQAGKSFTVNATVTNTGTSELASSDNGNPFSLNAGDNSGANSYWGFPDNNLGVSLFPGQSVPVSFTISDANLPSPPNPAQEAIWAHVAYSNDFNLGGQCTANVDMYVPFGLTGGSSSSPVPSTEDPTSLTYKTWVNNSAPVAVSIPAADGTSVSSVYEKPAGGGTRVIVPGYDDSGPFAAGAQTVILNGSSSILPPLQAGDAYYAEIDVPFTSAYVGANGPGDVVDPTTPATYPAHFTVQNTPFFKVYNGSASAGGAFKSASPNCSGGGVLASWNNDSGTYPSGDFGASAQIGALALGPITGFASNQSAFSNNPAGLSFANSVLADKSPPDTYSPALGGNFNTAPGAGDCFTDVIPPAGVTPTAGPVTIGGRTVSPGASQNQSVFVNGANGNVYISGNILYKGDNGLTGSAAAWNSPSDVPSFVVHATGNIYIGSNVTELDGLYEANGKIYTCAQNTVPYSAVPFNQMYTKCNKQLTVYGKFVANQINMARTFGSLRDETPIPGTAPTLAAGEQLSKPPQRRPTQYVHICNVGSTTYITQGSPNCLPGGSYSGDYGPGVPGTTYDIPCYNLTGTVIRLVYISAPETCPAGTTAVGASLPGGTPAHAPSPAELAALNSGTGCSNNGGGWLSPQTCAAEVFYATPELYLSSPALGQPSYGAPQWDSITSLPPLL